MNHLLLGTLAALGGGSLFLWQKALLAAPKATAVAAR